MSTDRTMAIFKAMFILQTFQLITRSTSLLTSDPQHVKFFTWPTTR